MKPANFLPAFVLAILQLSNASSIPNHPRGAIVPRADCSFSDFVGELYPSICFSGTKLKILITLLIITVCIVNLAELPMQITTCAEAVEDINKADSANDGSPSIIISKVCNSLNRPTHAGFDPIKTAAQGADCIAEAFLAAVELVRPQIPCVLVVRRAYYCGVAGALWWMLEGPRWRVPERKGSL